MMVKIIEDCVPMGKPRLPRVIIRLVREDVDDILEALDEARLHLEDLQRMGFKLLNIETY